MTFPIIDRIAEIMQNRGMTRYALSQLTGITQATISAWFTEKSIPDTDTLEKFCDGVGITLCEFFKTTDMEACILTPNESKTLKKYRILNNIQRNSIENHIDSYLSENVINKLNK